MTLPAALDLVVEVSLDGSGAYTGTYDEFTDAVAPEPGISVELGREGGRALSPARIPSASYEVRNQDSHYSLEHPTAPVYQVLLPGRPSRVRGSYGETRAYRSATAYRSDAAYRGVRTWTLFSGAIEQIDQTSDFGNERVGLEHLGTMSVLLNASVTVALQTAIRTDQALSLLLDAASWPTDKRSIGVGDSVLLYWWCDDRPAWDAILELLASEGPCQLYQDADGVIHFEGRNYRTITPRSMTAVASFRSVPKADETVYVTHFRYQAGFDRIYNRAVFPTRRRELGALAAVWEYGADFVLASNESRTVTGRPSDPFSGAVVPVNGTDYTVTAGGLATVPLLSSTSGLAFDLTITAGASGATLAGLQVRAQPLTVVSETEVANDVDASASIAKFSLVPGGNVPRTLHLRGWPEIEPAQAVAVCNAWVNRYKENRPQATATLRNADADHLRQILERDVSDRVTLIDGNSGLGRDAWIEAKRLTVSGTGGAVIAAEFDCEVSVELTGAVWDESEWDDAAAVWGV